ncbi:MAG: hypothetical protein U0457_19195 [Candidatus Sericytochromatia bacterium]
MKKLVSLFTLSVFSISVLACQNSQNINNLEKNTEIQSSIKKDSAYPFDSKSDYYPLYEGSSWKYEVFDKSKKSIGLTTRTINSNNSDSIEFDKKNNYFIVSNKREQNFTTNEKTEFEQIRRKGNQLAFGKYDSPVYYPSNEKSSKAFNPNDFRPFIDFSKNNKTETIKVKAGTFECIKAEFTINLDAYTIWYAKNIGEVKRIRESNYTSYYSYELSEYNQGAKNFVIKKEALDFNSLPDIIKTKAELAKKEYLKMNNLPEKLFDSSSFLGFISTNVSHDNLKNLYDISFISKSLTKKDNVRLLVSFDHEANIKNMSTLNENNEKSTYNGSVVDKIPTLL